MTEERLTPSGQTQTPSWRRIAVAVLVMVLVVVVAAQQWIGGHTTDLVVVNASGKALEISWQPGPGTMTSVGQGGCESRSLPISRTASWAVKNQDGETILDSASANVPPFARLMAVEIWLDPNGHIGFVPPHDIDRLVDAPDPGCQNAAP